MYRLHDGTRKVDIGNEEYDTGLPMLAGFRESVRELHKMLSMQVLLVRSFQRLHGRMERTCVD
jgi:hypothetical protein